MHRCHLMHACTRPVHVRLVCTRLDQITCLSAWAIVCLSAWAIVDPNSGPKSAAPSAHKKRKRKEKKRKPENLGRVHVHSAVLLRMCTGGAVVYMQCCAVVLVHTLHRTVQCRSDISSESSSRNGRYVAAKTFDKLCSKRAAKESVSARVRCEPKKRKLERKLYLTY